VKLFYTVAAVDDLDRLRAFIAVSNPIAGRRIVNRLQDAAAQLTRHPLIGVATEQSPDIRDLIVDSYLIRSQVRSEDDRITILCIWHGKEDLR